MRLRSVRQMGTALVALALLATPSFAQRGGGHAGGGHSGGGHGGFGGFRGGGAPHLGSGGGIPRGNLGSVPSFSRPSAPSMNHFVPHTRVTPSRATIQTPRQTFGQNSPNLRGNLPQNVPNRLPNVGQTPLTDHGNPRNALGGQNALGRQNAPGRNTLPGNAINRDNNAFSNNALNRSGLSNPNRVTVNRPDALGNRINNNLTNNNVNARIGNGTNFNHRFGNTPHHWNPYRYSGWNRGTWNVWGPGYAFNRYGYGGNGYSGYGPGLGYGGFGYGLGYGGLGYGSYGGYGWYGRSWGPLAAIGLTSWALGGLYYGTGYGAYMNPYYSSGAGYYNYSQPIAYVGSADPGAPQAPPEDSASAFQAARDAFHNGDYQGALQQVDQAIAKNPNDPALHEFRGLTLFALQRYPEAAAAVYAVLSVGPGMNWSSLISLYPSVDTYTPQLRALEASVRQNPMEPNGHFLLAYQYMTAGHTEAARAQFQKSSELSSNDAVSRQMIRLLAPPAPNSTDNTSTPADSNPLPPAAPPNQTSTPILPQPVGNYDAATANQGHIALQLKDDGTFQWNLKQGDKPRNFTGKYTLEGNTLALEFQDGGGMVGKVEPKGNGFHFAVIDGPTNDPGLDFTRN